MRNAECGMWNAELKGEVAHTLTLPWHSAFRTPHSKPPPDRAPRRWRRIRGRRRTRASLMRFPVSSRSSAKKPALSRTTTVSEGGEIVTDATGPGLWPLQLHARLLLACHTYARYVDPYDCSGDRVESDRRGAHRGPACPPRG